MTLSIIIPAILTFFAGIIMMFPNMRRRASERGMSEDILVPGFIAIIGSILFLIGVYV